MALFLLIAAGVLILDQATKLLVVLNLPLYSSVTIIQGFFNLVHVHNTGGAFSLLAGANAAWRKPLFIGLTLVVMTILLIAYGKIKREDYWTRTAYALVFGGALGNLVDRSRMGEVIDFLDVYVGSYHWPAFNVADSAITVGACLLLVSLIRGK